MLNIKSRVRGFSMVEMMVTVAILAILTSIALPSFTSYLQSLAVRNVGEALLAATQKARGEAIRSNNTAILQIVSSLDNSCAADSGGRFWVVSHCAADGFCGAEVDKTKVIPNAGCEGAPVILAKGSFEGSGNVEIDIPSPTLCYSSLGRINPEAGSCPAGSLNPGADGIVINITHNQGDCADAGGKVRCLQLNIGMGGEPRLCDPGITASDDPRGC